MGCLGKQGTGSLSEHSEGMGPDEGAGGLRALDKSNVESFLTGVLGDPKAGA